MSFGPVRAARVDFSDPAAPRSPDFGDLYHARAGALAQARHVFLGGNTLPARWAGRRRFVILETGFGLGNNFLATWDAWRGDARRCDQLWFVSIEKHPPTRADLARAHADSPLRALADELHAHWPPLTPDLHLIDFEHGRVRLLLVLADIAEALPELGASTDAFYLDGFAPSCNPAMWDAYRLRSLARLAAPGATLATWSVAGAVRDALASAGFEVGKAPGFAGKREMTVARFAPRFNAPCPPGRRPCAAQRVAVVGAGLAGAAVARALAAQGIDVEVVERCTSSQRAAARNVGGLFHGAVHGGDGTHARWLRAAALHAQRVLHPLIRAGVVPGSCDGLLRGEHVLPLDAMRALLQAQALPPDWVQALDAEAASALAGSRRPGPGWFYPGGGWIAPGALVAHWLHGAGDAPGITLRLGCTVASLQRDDPYDTRRGMGHRVQHDIRYDPEQDIGHDGARWRLLDTAGALITRCDAVVLANAADAFRLLHSPAWPWSRTRGQVSLVAADTPGLPRLPVPLADSGYALRLPDGQVLCGATSQPGDDDPNVRDADHAHNLAVLQRLTGWSPTDADALRLTGRVGWRVQSADRLPLLGPVPSATPADALRRDQPRFAPREAGLYVLSALGSRGLTHAALAGEVLASWISGAPIPAPASLLDALDPARFAARAARRRA